MSLSVAIVGLPNVGKSTLFNALLKRQQALVANYPFTTIKPNVGIVEVPDERLGKLKEIVERDPSTSLRMNSVPVVPATIQFIDIAGLVAGAAQGEGLGNQFLAHIRECDLICHVLRAFDDPDVVVTGKMDPIEDLQTVRTELALKDLESLLKQKEPKGTVDKKEKQRWSVIKKIKVILDAGIMPHQILRLPDSSHQIRHAQTFGSEVQARRDDKSGLKSLPDLSSEELENVSDLHLLSTKPEIFVVNVAESKLKSLNQGFHLKIGVPENEVVYICAKIEAELSVLSEEDQRLYLADSGLQQSGIEQMAQAAYRQLGLISFFTTTGLKEVRAWTLRRGSTALRASSVIHTDFVKKFIKAKVCSFQDFVSLGGWKKAAEAGKVRQEGRDYLIQDGEVVEFMIGK